MSRKRARSDLEQEPAGSKITDDFESDLKDLEVFEYNHSPNKDTNENSDCPPLKRRRKNPQSSTKSNKKNKTKDDSNEQKSKTSSNSNNTNNDKNKSRIKKKNKNKTKTKKKTKCESNSKSKKSKGKRKNGIKKAEESLSDKQEREEKLILELKKYESDLYDSGNYSCIVGVDEAGRGPLAGPVVICACYIPLNIKIYGIGDSKALKEEERDECFRQLINNNNVKYAVSIINHKIIDELNILGATLKGMRDSVVKLQKILYNQEMQEKNLTIKHDVADSSGGSGISSNNSISDGKDGKDGQETKDTKARKANKDKTDANDVKDEQRGQGEQAARDAKASKDKRTGKDGKDRKDTKDGNDGKSTKDTKMGDECDNSNDKDKLTDEMDSSNNNCKHDGDNGSNINIKSNENGQNGDDEKECDNYNCNDKQEIDMILVDGNRDPKYDGIEILRNAECRTIIKGDSKVYCIGAASIIAKVVRDRLMCEYSEIYPQYLFSVHKGYPTPFHKSIVIKQGPCDIHRTSFNPVKQWCLDNDRTRLPTRLLPKPKPKAKAKKSKNKSKKQDTSKSKNKRKNKSRKQSKSMSKKMNKGESGKRKNSEIKSKTKRGRKSSSIKMDKNKSSSKEKEKKKENKKVEESEAKQMKFGLSDDDLSDYQSDDSDYSSKSVSNKENVRGEKKSDSGKIQNQHKFTMMTFLKNKNKGKKPN